MSSVRLSECSHRLFPHQRRNALVWSLLAAASLLAGCADEPSSEGDSPEGKAPDADAAARHPADAACAIKGGDPHAVSMETVRLNTPEETGRYDRGFDKPPPAPEEMAAAVAAASATSKVADPALLAEQQRYLEAWRKLREDRLAAGGESEEERGALKQRLIPPAPLPGGDFAITGTAARVRDLDATPIFGTSIGANAGVGYTITTSNLAPATADTVLHVLDMTDPNAPFFIGGNDDSGGTLASSVVVAPSSSYRVLRVVVRAFVTARNGTATLTVTRSAGGGSSQSIVFGGNTFVPSTALAAQAHVMTVEQAGGSPDTVLLVTSGGAANAISLDDDNGVGAMSWLHLNSACSSCTIVVGSYSSSSNGKTTLIWDEDAHAPTVCDADGMSDALDRALGTDPCKTDTDGDGLTDGAEVIGLVETAAGPAVKLPMYGADPMRRDVFVELDWNACAPGSCGPSNDPDYFRMTSDRALALAALYAPDVAMHLDTGVPNADPATRTIYNAWGGARRVAAEGCNNLAPERAGVFHHVSLVMKDGNGQGYQPGTCVLWSSSMPEVVAHELGHNLGLDHGGSIAAGRANFKLSYRSIMNYAYSYAGVGFSRGVFSSVGLNPIALDETRGLGTGENSSIAFVTQWPWLYTLGASGSIDWNRDGVISPSSSPVRAPLGFVPGAADQLSLHRNALAASNHPVGAWTRTTGGVSTFAMVTRRISNGSLELRTAPSSSFASCESFSSACATWSPAASAAPSLIVTLGGTLAPAVVRLTGSPDRLLVVAPGATNQLTYTIGTLTSATTSTWTAPVGLPGSPVTDRDPALIEQGGVISLYARSGGVLKRWDFNPTTQAWSAPVNQLWSNGTAVVPGTGIGLTRGYQRDLAAQQTYALIPDASGLLSFARYDTTSARWLTLPAFDQPLYTVDRPSLVYVPVLPSTPTRGRFHLSMTRANGDPWQHRAAMSSMTDGNDVSSSATTAKLKFAYPAFLGNEWSQANGGAQLVYNLGFDDHVRALMTYSPYDWATGVQVPSQTQFLPLADGIYNQVQRDENDFTRMRSFLDCSLHGGCVDF